MKSTFIVIMMFFIVNTVSAVGLQKIFECKMEESGKTIFIKRSDKAHYLQFADKEGTDLYFTTLDHSKVTVEDDSDYLEINYNYMERYDRYNPSFPVVERKQLFVDKRTLEGHFLHFYSDSLVKIDDIFNFAGCRKLY